jgi:hypothetical protein
LTILNRMFWGGKKKEDDKEKQIKQLKGAFPSLRRPNNDDSMFEFRFTVNSEYNTLRVTLPPDFPSSKPCMYIFISYILVSI